MEHVGGQGPLAFGAGGYGRCGSELAGTRPCRCLDGTAGLLVPASQACSSQLCCVWALPEGGTPETWDSLAPHTYARIRLVLRHSEAARAICTLPVVLFAVGVDEDIGTGLWNNTTAGGQIKMEPGLLKKCHSIAGVSSGNLYRGQTGTERWEASLGG